MTRLTLALVTFTCARELAPQPTPAELRQSVIGPPTVSLASDLGFEVTCGIERAAPRRQGIRDAERAARR